MTLEFPGQMSEKYLNIKFHKDPSSGSRVVSRGRTDGRTDRQTDIRDEANSHFSQFCESA